MNKLVQAAEKLKKYVQLEFSIAWSQSNPDRILEYKGTCFYLTAQKGSREQNVEDEPQQVLL